MTDNLDELRAEVVEHGVLDYDQAQELLDRVEAAEAAVQRVREMHAPFNVNVHGVGNVKHCKHCYEIDFTDAEYPCDTIRALDGGEQE